MKLRLLAVPCVALFAVSCAKSPESIEPSYVSPAAYADWSCKALNAEGERVDAALTVASKQQSNARGGDIAGVILLGLPVSTLSGANIAPEVARLKGHKETISREQARRGCS